MNTLVNFGSAQTSNTGQFSVGRNTYSFTLADQIDHATLNGLAGDNEENDLAINLSSLIRATDFDGDTVASGASGLVITVDDDTPVIENKSNLVYANSLNGSTGGTGIFDYSIGADERSTPYSASNSDFSTITLNGKVGSATIVSPTVTWVNETATTATFDVQFSYAANPTAPGTLTVADGTLIFNKVTGTYNFVLDAPIQSFTILSTSAQGVTFTGYDENTSNVDAAGMAQVVVAGLASNFFAQFTGDDQGGGPLTAGGNSAFANGELFSGTNALTSASGAAIGVSSDTMQDGEVLDMDFFNTNPTGMTSLPPSALASGIFLTFDGFGSEDVVVILKLVNLGANGVLGGGDDTFLTKAIIVDSGDIYTNNVGNTPPAGFGISLDNNDGAVIIESNDYNVAVGENWLIQGAQVMVSTEGITGTGINLNKLVGAPGGSTTFQDFEGTAGGLADADTDDNDVLKISSIGFITATTDTQDANLDFSFTVVDADGDATATQILHVTIEGGTNFVGTASADVIQGDGGADVMQGNAGNDILVYDPADFPGAATTVYDGGADNDTLRFDGAGQSLDLTGLAQTKIQNVENIDLTGTGDNTLALTLQDVLDLSSTSNQVVVLGNVGDIVNSTGQGWVQGANQAIGPQTYATYTNGSATLLVDIDVTRNILP